MLDKIEKEVWKQYPDYDFIEVSNLGRVRTKDRTVIRSDGRKRFVKGQVLKQHDNGNGYLYVHFRVDDKMVSLRVNRAVAITFIPNPYNYPVVNHIDNNRMNNAASNLEWCTRVANEAYKKNFGTSQVQVQGTPVIAINTETYESFLFESQREAARQLRISSKHISAVSKGLRRTTYGFWFCYADENAVEKVREKFGDEIAKKVEELISQNQNQ